MKRVYPRKPYRGPDAWQAELALLKSAVHASAVAIPPIGIWPGGSPLIGAKYPRAHATGTAGTSGDQKRRGSIGY